MSQLVAIVMAAGQGTRMKSALPKVLHPACGRPLVYYPIRAALDAGASRIVVVVSPSSKKTVLDELGAHLPADTFSIAVQEAPRGTGDAARSGLESVSLQRDDRVLVLSGDTPLLRASDLTGLLSPVDDGSAELCFMSFLADDPTGYGRVLRDEKGDPCAIVEHRDLKSDGERAIKEVNAGVYAGLYGPLQESLSGLSCDNAQGEYYLTDIVKCLAKTRTLRTSIAVQESLMGVNDRAQLAHVEEILFERIRTNWAHAGVSIVGKPYIDDTVSIEPEARIETGVRLRGGTQIGAGTTVDVGTVVTDTHIGEGCTIKPYCCLTESRIGASAQIGPFAHLRPGSVLEEECHVGNYVETKKTTLRRGAKANHLSYIGDADIGEKTNIGAGTIFCNYDGFRKQRTTVGRGVFIGSDSHLIAPVKIGDRAYIATNTTVNQDVPDGALAIGRSRQINKEGYGDALRTKLEAEVKRKK